MSLSKPPLISRRSSPAITVVVPVPSSRAPSPPEMRSRALSDDRLRPPLPSVSGPLSAPSVRPRRGSFSVPGQSSPSGRRGSFSVPGQSSPSERRGSLSENPVSHRRSSKDLREHRHHHQCEGCQQFFVSVFVLERHLPRCKGKPEEVHEKDPVYETLDVISTISSLLSVL